MINLDNLGPALAILRVRKGIMQKQIAESEGMSCSQISRYERGRDVPNLVTLSRFLNAIGADFRDLDAAMLQAETGAQSQPPLLPTDSSFRDLVMSVIDEDVLRSIVDDLVVERLNELNGDQGSKLIREQGFACMDLREQPESCIKVKG